MRKRNGLLSLIFMGILCFSLNTYVSTDVWAAESIDDELYEMASSIVGIEESVQASGAVVTTYDNLNAFVDNVRNQDLAVSDLELARFIMEFTEQSSDGLQDEQILEMLEYDNISTSNVYLIRDTNGEVEEISKDEALIATADDWTSSDGVMKITTSFTKTNTDGSTKYFTVWANATWLKISVNKMADVFILGTNGVFNDAFTEQGNVNQVFECKNGCSKQTKRYRSVNANSTLDGDLSMDYDSFVPCLRFESIDTRCDYCTNGSSAECTTYNAYIKYGVIANGTANIQAAYGHKTFGPASIGVEISATGLPALSITFPSKMTSYTARSITLS